MLMDLCAGSMNDRFRSTEQSAFFQPVDFDFELTDLLIELGLKSLGLFSRAFTLCREDLRQSGLWPASSIASLDLDEPRNDRRSR
jgi:hypothetical protein